MVMFSEGNVLQHEITSWGQDPKFKIKAGSKIQSRFFFVCMHALSKYVVPALMKIHQNSLEQMNLPPIVVFALLTVDC